MSLLYSLLSFCVTIGIVVTVHELGHYLAARWRSVPVEIFALGFGTALASWRDRHGTVWKIGWLPIGGYVQMPKLEQYSLPSRVLVVAAGPFANIVFAMVMITLIFMVLGIPTDRPVIGYVAPETPAARAGLLPEDRITAMDDIPVTSFDELRASVEKHAGKTVMLTVERDGVKELLPTIHDSRGILGIKPAIHSIGVLQALAVGPVATWLLIKATIGALLHVKAADLSGPVGIAQVSGQAAQDGLEMWLFVITVLSINLGIFNLIPIPVMDGGRLLYYAIEAVIGRPLSQGVQFIGMATSTVFLIGLFVFVTWHDVVRLLK